MRSGKPISNNAPRVIALVNDSFVFHFLSEEDRLAVEERFWVYSKGSMVLFWWSVDFDPRMAKLTKRHLWVILHRFPLFCWNIEGYRAIASSIGKFIHIEDSHLIVSDRKAPPVLVEMETKNELPEELEVVWEGGSSMKKLYYCHVPL